MKAIVIGGGQVGKYVADLVLKNKVDVKIIDNDRQECNQLAERFGGDNVIYGSGTSPVILESAGIEDADVVAIVTGSDSVNLVAATIAKFEFQTPRVIARVNSPSNSWLFSVGMGVDAAINQADIIGHMLVEEMSTKSLMTLMRMSRGSYSIVQVVVSATSSVCGKKIKDIKIPSDSLMIAIYRGETTVIPHGDTLIFPGDKIMFFAKEEEHGKLDSIFGIKL